jgi:hypothetical protein
MLRKHLGNNSPASIGLTVRKLRLITVRIWLVGTVDGDADVFGLLC